MQNLTYFEHLAEPMAEMLNILEKEFDHTSLTEEILRYVIAVISYQTTKRSLNSKTLYGSCTCREISAKKFSAADTKGPRAFSRFLIRLSELSTRMIMKQISLLLRHLESEVSLYRKPTRKKHLNSCYLLGTSHANGLGRNRWPSYSGFDS